MVATFVYNLKLSEETEIKCARHLSLSALIHLPAAQRRPESKQMLPTSGSFFAGQGSQQCFLMLWLMGVSRGCLCAGKWEGEKERRRGAGKEGRREGALGSSSLRSLSSPLWGLPRINLLVNSNISADFRLAQIKF